MATPSAQTKTTAVSKIFKKMGQIATPAAGGNPVQLLGEIFKMLKVMDEDRKLNQEMANSHVEEQEHEKEKRNKEIIRALTGRKKPKVKPKKVEKKKPEEKVPEKVEAPKPKPEPAKPVETPKPAPKPEPAKPVEAPKPLPKAEPVKPPAPVTKPPILPAAPLGPKSLVIAAMLAANISEKSQANILANVEEESGFKPRSEDLGRYSGKTLFRLYGPPGVAGGQPEKGKNKVRFNTLNEANELVSKGAEAVGDVIYGGRMGNNSPGDGFKYRGRGFIQITGKDMYKQIGAAIGEDLIGNPDLANDPRVAARIVPAFFKLKLNKRKPKDLENIDVVNEMVGSASEESRNKRRKLAESYENTIGSDIASLSTENRDLKKDMNAQQAVQNQVNNTVVNQTTTETQNKPIKVDDSNPMIEKGKR